ncbi:MAG: type II secretion system protein GspG [Planctomycetota bacterium]|nr:type II secretion system protein GspG [Planctomycetota bacterium]
MRKGILIGVALCALALLAAAVAWRARMIHLSTTISRKDRADILAIEWACEAYAHDHDGCWPPELAALVAREPGRYAYLHSASVPLDPWGRAYLYLPPGSPLGRPWIWTFGRDGRPGGAGDDEDIWNGVPLE